MKTYSKTHQGSNHHLFPNESEIQNLWTALEKSFFTGSSVEPQIFDSVKTAMNNVSGSNFTLLSQNDRQINFEQKRHEYARGFAVLFAISPESILPQHYRLLNEVFSKSEIAELCAFICYTYSMLQFCSMVAYR